MKKESVNTFNEGLVYDLNPITTPNNVLTDCVNGTFLTFNADELALQNDAGNTTIGIYHEGLTEYDSTKDNYEIGDNVYTLEEGVYTYYRNLTGNNDGTLNTTDWLELVVKLSEGFYPLGIKEYGGILYIVSAKRPTIVPTEFENISYDKEDVVYIERIGINYYFESLINNNINSLPYESNEFWLFIGIEKDFINRYGYIEFGSYPSPEVFNAEQFDGSVNFNCINLDDTAISPPDSTGGSISNTFVTNTLDFKNKLYTPQIINNSVFQAGVYVQFSQIAGTNLITNQISYSSFTNTEESSDPILVSYERKIYKIKLYHQLTNGFIDLTDDIWQSYARFRYINYSEDLNSSYPFHFWFLDSNFKYYCPHNYKGKLVMSVELEELDEFSINPTTIELIGGNYIVSFPINYINTTEWINLLSPTVTLAYTIDDSITINTPMFIGTGNNDLTTSGIYTGEIDKTLLIKISTSGTSDKFDWSLDNGNSWIEQDIDITTDPIILAEGVSITFGASTGHDEDDYWKILLSPLPDINVEPDLEIPSNINTIISNIPLVVTNNIGTITLSLNAETYQGKILKYKIVPEFSNDLNFYLPFSSYLPQEFINAHTIYGSELITNKYDDYIIEPQTPKCDPNVIGFKIYDHLILKDIFGYVDNELVASVEKFGFFWEGADPAPSLTPGAGEIRWLGTYIYDSNNKAKIIPTSYNPLLPLGSNQTYISDLVENTIVRIEDISCTPFVVLTVIVNKDFGQEIPISVTQGPLSIDGHKISDCTYTFNVQSSVEFQINTKDWTPYSFTQGTSNYPYSDTIISDSTVYFGIISNIYSYIEIPSIPGINPATVSLYTAFDEQIFGPQISGELFTIERVSVCGTPSEPINQVYLKHQYSSVFTKYSGLLAAGGCVETFRLTFDSSSTTHYDNLDTPLGYFGYSMEGDNHIFLKSTILPEKPLI